MHQVVWVPADVQDQVRRLDLSAGYWPARLARYGDRAEDIAAHLLAALTHRRTEAYGHHLGRGVTAFRDCGPDVPDHQPRNVRIGQMFPGHRLVGDALLIAVNPSRIPYRIQPFPETFIQRWLTNSSEPA